MKKMFIYSMLIFFISCKSQVTNEQTFDSIKIKLIDFLQSKSEIDSVKANKLINGEHTFNLRGIFNNKHKGELINGLYAFSAFSSSSRGFFIIVENNSFIILDLSTREDLDKSIKEVLDFAERSKYCVTISSEIVSRLVTVYYNKNKNILAGIDLNCERGISNTADLP